MHRALPVPSALLIVVASCLLLACETRGPESSPDGGGGGTRSPGETCATHDDCVTGLCLEVGAGRSVCTRTCEVDLDCPGGESWGCVLPERFATRVCGCSATASAEVCGDGLDNECNGRADDCRHCDGVPTPEDDPRHCGECGNACRSDQECSAGACECPAGRVECDGRCVDVATDELACGTCGNECSIGASCAGGACTCPAGTPDDCGVRCTNVRTDSAHCGACGNACEAGLACVGGTCRCADPTFSLHCPDVGCVDRLNDPRNCGACGNVCPSAQRCSAGVCACPVGGESLCDGVCIDTSYDTANCGACGRTCAPGEYCSGGICFCDSGLHCGGRCVDRVDRTNCGDCGVACRADQVCAGRSGCACSWPLSECGAACVDLSSDEASCGTCGNVCAPTQTCSSGTCRCTVPGTTFCPALGACVDLRTDESSCGACGNVCPAAQTCTSSACRCPISGQTYCAATGTCVDFSTDEANCGGCGNVCPGATTCQFGSCRCPSSSQQYCSAVDACVDVLADEAHCGGCGNVCPATTSCQSGGCRCDAAGQTLCGTTCTDLQTDESSCGSCGRMCTGGRECISGACQCPAPAPGSLVRLTTSTPYSSDVRVASDGSRVAMVWSEHVATSTSSSVRFVLLEPTGARVAGTELVLAAETTGAGSPDVVWTGSAYGVTWHQIVGTERHAMFQRFDAAGAPIGSPVSVTDAWPGTVTIDVTRVAHAPGSGFGMLIRNTSSEIYFQLLGADATALPLPVRMSSAPWGIGGPFGIVGAHDGRFALQYGQYVQMVNADGSVTTPSVTVASNVAASAIAWDGEAWVVAGRRSVYTTTSRTQVVLQRGSTVHVVFDAPSSAVTLDDVTFTVSGGVAQLLWTDDLDSSGSRRLQTARVRLPSAGGSYTVLTTATLFMPDYTVANDAPPVATFVGPTAWLAAWPDTRWGQYEIYALPATLPACM